jgi:PAS domain S-box-containing protein
MDDFGNNEENFLAFFNAVDDILIVGSSEGKVIYTNPATSKKLGYSQEELKGMLIINLHPPDLREEANEILTAMLQKKQDYCPLPMQTRDGRILPVETRVWQGRWDGMDCIFGISKDLTTQEEALQKFDRFFHNNPTPMALTSVKNMKLIDVNEAFLSTLGYKKEEIIGKKSIELDLFVDKEKQEKVAKDLIKNHSVKNIELKVNAKNGKILYGLFSGDLIQSQGKEYLLTVMVDITDRKMAEEALKEREKYQETIFSAILTGLVVVDAETKKIVDLNDVAADLIGTSKDQIIGNICHKFICPAEEDECPIIDLNQEVDNSQRILLNIQGKKIPIIKNVVKIKLNGRDHLLESFIDITERLKAEEQIKQSLKDKDMLIGEIHHRVKNNLLIITSLLSLQSSYVEDKKSQSLFEESENRTRSMAMIHEKLYQSGEAKSIDFEEYIQSLGNELYNTYALNSNLIKLEMNLEKNLILDVDTAIPLGLIFNELFTNSLKHAFPDNREGTIKVGFHKKDENYQLTVEDDGIGLPEDFSIEESDTFGLQLVDALTQQIDAQVDVDSSQGTKYTITFQEEKV